MRRSYFTHIAARVRREIKESTEKLILEAGVQLLLAAKYCRAGLTWDTAEKSSLTLDSVIPITLHQVLV